MKAESKTVTFDTITTHYLEAGKGPTVLLLHGGEFGAAAELSWEFTIDHLSRSYRVIAPDWLGYGGTDKIYDFTRGGRRRIEHMASFIRHMGIGGSHIVGHSMGGTILAQIISTEAELFQARSATLISGGGVVPDNAARQTLMDYDCTRESMREVLKVLFYDPKWSQNEEYLERRLKLSLVPGAWECTAAARFKNPTLPERSQFGHEDKNPYEKISIPTLVIAGANDPLREKGYANEMAKRIPDNELHILEQCSHCAQIEKPQEVLPLMTDFLSRAQNKTTNAR